MASQEQLAILKQGVQVWNEWRKEHTEVKPDLSGADLHQAKLFSANLSEADLSRAILREADLNGTYFIGANLEGADLREANGWYRGFERGDTLQLDDVDFSKANLSKAILTKANFSEATFEDANMSNAQLSGAILYSANLSRANLSKANLHGTDLRHANLSGTDLRSANLSGAELRDADLSRADLWRADLSWACLVHTNLKRAKLDDCLVYGIAAWDVDLAGATQSNLVITPKNLSTITVDNLKIAQFIYLLLNSQELRDVIDTITSKVVLILGRFTPERIAILNALRNALHRHNYSPIVFDFEIPESRDITETVSLLARMARFVIADLTDAKSVPQELSVIVPDLPSVPVQPLLQATDKAYSMFEHWMRYSSVLKIYYYTSVDDLLPALKEHIISPAEQKVQELKRPQ